MKKTVFIIIINLLLVISAEKAYSQAGTLDVTFDGDGIVLDVIGNAHDRAYSVIAQPDTTIIVGGIAQWNGYLGQTESIIRKYNSDGSVDTSFGTGGIVRFLQGTGSGAYLSNLIQQSDGKLVMAGAYYQSGYDAAFFVARYNSDGSPDNTFNGTGYVSSAYSSDDEECHAFVIQPDGKYLLAGRTYSGGGGSQSLFLRVNVDGTIDNTFGTNGYAAVDAGALSDKVTAIGLLSNGDIVGFGDAWIADPLWGDQAFMVKLDQDGNPITSFGNNGVFTPAIFNNELSMVNAMEVVNDTLILTGRIVASGDGLLYVAKLDENGIEDPSFGTNGISTLSINNNEGGLDLMISGDNKIYVSGYHGTGFLTSDILIARYLYDGILDPAFNTTGYVTTAVRPDGDEAASIDMQVDGKIIGEGMSSGQSTSGYNDLTLVRYLNDYVPFGADFTASETYICDGSTVTFTDQSGGNITGWNWSFEGGSPATSTAQNPTVTYNTTGLYDVQLVITDGTNYDTLLRQDYIEVVTTPGQATTPAGGTNACAGSNINYTTNSVQFATSYQWEVDPPDAGNMNGTGTTATFESSASFSGSYTIKVRANNMCGTGPWSPDFQGNLVASPQAFTLQGDGAYCEGSQGAELTLDGSETGVDYELYLDDVATGNIVAGTGSSISFGYVTDEGIYTAVGASGDCETDMYGQIWVHMIGMPGQAATPEGPEQICNDTTTTYTTTGASDADTLIWTLDPVDAGTLTPNGQEASIEWSVDFSGIALLYVTGENECGTGDPSDNLEIEVFATPQPVISGDTFTCQYYQGIVYTTANNPDNTYTWEISGGTIASGTGTHEVLVDWGAPGQGWMRVTEESPEGCISITEDYMVTIDECVGIEEFSVEDIHIYPNPANDHINIEVPAEFREEFMIRIIDLAGRTVAQYRKTPVNGKLRINISELMNGIYAIEVSNDELGKITNRIVKN